MDQEVDNSPQPNGQEQAEPAAPSKAIDALRMLNDKEASLRAREQELSAREQSLQTNQSPEEGLNDLEALRTQAPDPSKDIRLEMEQKYEELSNKLAQWEQKERNAKVQQVHQGVRDSVHSHLDSSDEYPFLNAAGDEARELVFQQIIGAHESQGRFISEAEAAGEVEANLKHYAEKLVPVWQALQAQGNKPAASTLTNNLAGQARTKTSYADLDPEEALKLLMSRM